MYYVLFWKAHYRIEPPTAIRYAIFSVEVTLDPDARSCSRKPGWKALMAYMATTMGMPSKTSKFNKLL